MSGHSKIGRHISVRYAEPGSVKEFLSAVRYFGLGVTAIRIYAKLLRPNGDYAPEVRFGRGASEQIILDGGRRY